MDKKKDYGFVSSALIVASLISFWRAERLGLRIKRLNTEVNETNNTMNTNLNQYKNKEMKSHKLGS